LLFILFFIASAKFIQCPKPARNKKLLNQTIYPCRKIRYLSLLFTSIKFHNQFYIKSQFPFSKITLKNLCRNPKKI